MSLHICIHDFPLGSFFCPGYWCLGLVGSGFGINANFIEFEAKIRLTAALHAPSYLSFLSEKRFHG